MSQEARKAWCLLLHSFAPSIDQVCFPFKCIYLMETLRLWWAFLSNNQEDFSFIHYYSFLSTCQKPWQCSVSPVCPLIINKTLNNDSTNGIWRRQRVHQKEISYQWSCPGILGFLSHFLWQDFIGWWQRVPPLLCWVRPSLSTPCDYDHGCRGNWNSLTISMKHWTKHIIFSSINYGRQIINKIFSEQVAQDMFLISN